MHRTVIAAASALLVMLAGCGTDDPAPAPAPSTSAAASTAPTTDPGPVEPTLPAAAMRGGKAGAEAFVVHYWAMVDYAQASGDVEPLEALNMESCSPCHAGADWIAEIADRGGKILGSTHRVARARSVPASRSNGVWLTYATVRTTPERVIGAGDLNRRGGAGVIEALLTTVHTSSGWLMSDLDEQ